MAYFANNIGGASMRGRHVIVIESDDWGSIRVPSDSVKETLNLRGANLDSEPFTKYDGLERAEDVQAMVELMKKIVDINGRNPIVTAFYAVSNADFEEIEKSRFGVFKNESFLKTSERYDQNSDLAKQVKSAISEGILVPELHGCEHLNRALWMNDLNEGRADTVLAFENGMYGIGSNFEADNPYGYMDAFHNRSASELLGYEQIIEEAVLRFENIFGTRPRVFTAPCYVWDPMIEDYLFEQGIMYIGGANRQQIPQVDNYNAFKKVKHMLGSHNKNGQIYLTRNVEFEPIYGGSNIQAAALRQIAAAFKMGKPAIISIHRANFSSRICGDMRQDRLVAIYNMLKAVQEKWPDVEFMSSFELGEKLKEMHNAGKRK